MHFLGPSEHRNKKAVDIASSSSYKQKTHASKYSKLLAEQIEQLKRNPDIDPDLLSFFIMMTERDYAQLIGAEVHEDDEPEVHEDDVPEAAEVPEAEFPPQNFADGSEALVFRGKKNSCCSSLFIYSIF